MHMYLKVLMSGLIKLWCVPWKHFELQPVHEKMLQINRIIIIITSTQLHTSVGWTCGSSALFFFVALQKKQLLCPAAEFVLRDYTEILSGIWQGFVVSHTLLGNMADLLIWHGVHPCHLITGRILILKRQQPNVRETDCERERQNIWGERKNGMNPQTDGACMVDEQCKAMSCTLGASLDRLELFYYSEVISIIPVKSPINLIYCILHDVQRKGRIFFFL